MNMLRNLGRRFFSPSPGEVANASIAAINQRDWQALSDLLADDFYFVEGGRRIDGKETYLAAIKAVVAEAGDFQLLVDRCEVDGNMVTMRGSSHATSHSFRTAAIWRIEVVDGKLTQLQNFRASKHTRLHDFARKRN